MNGLAWLKRNHFKWANEKCCTKKADLSYYSKYWLFEEQGRSGLFKKAVYRLLKGNL